jgi:hypothetical protein
MEGGDWGQRMMTGGFRAEEALRWQDERSKILDREELGTPRLII